MIIDLTAIVLSVILSDIHNVATSGAPVDSYASGKYSDISNKELQSRALRLVKSLRALVHLYNRKDQDLTNEYQSTYLATRTTERHTVRDHWRKKMEDSHASIVRDYQQNFGSEVILVRDELYRRLPKRLRRANLLKLYQNLPNVLAIETIADDIELLSKSLPDT